jgi:hypothetical protein
MSKRRVACLLLLLPFVPICWLLMGWSFNFSGQTPIQQLESARKLWDQQGIDDYSMTLAYSTYNNIGRYDFVVQDKVPISVVSWNPIRPEWTPAPMQNFQSVKFPQDYGDYFPENLTDYTIDGLFDYATRKLADQPMTPLVTWCGIAERMHAEAAFDDQLGYIKSFGYNDCGQWDVGGGLLCGGIPHCSSGVRVLDFEPLE